MGIITREQFSEVQSTVYEFWDMKMKTKTDYNARLFNVQSSDKSREDHMGLGSIGQMDEWKGTVSYEEFKKGFKNGYVHAKYSKGIQLEEEIFRFKEYNKIKQRTNLLLDAVYKTLQAHGASVFNHAFDTAFAGPDGKPLCAADHPYGPSDTRTQSNRGSRALTMTNLTTTYNEMLDFRDDTGNQTFIMPKILLTGIYYREQGAKICGPKASMKEPFTGDNDANIYQGDLMHMFHPLITGKKWFLIDPDRMENYLNWYTARKPVIETDGDFDSETMKFKVVGMWSYGYDHWDWIAGNEG